MAEDAPLSPIERIDRALARIDSGIAAHARAHQLLAERHAALRGQIEHAVAALDGLIDQQENG